jgi:hypothetical protein
MFIEKLAPFGGRTFLGSTISMASSPTVSLGMGLRSYFGGQLGRIMS